MRFLIVDDHAVLRNGLTALLRQVEPEASVLEASDAAQGLELVMRHADLDAAFIDLEMPGIRGIPVIEEFGKRRPDLPIIVFSASEDPRDVRQALAAGALGYVPKSASATTLIAAVRLVLQGEVYVPPLMLNDAASEPTRAAAAETAPAAGRLTERQAEVLRRIALGQSNKEIANALDLSEKTVKVHVSGVFRTLNVVNRAQAAHAARQAGLV
jgi:two-component system, NarL family, nitrate/nitrite response regulator NarL